MLSRRFSFLFVLLLGFLAFVPSLMALPAAAEPASCSAQDALLLALAAPDAPFPAPVPAAFCPSNYCAEQTRLCLLGCPCGFLECQPASCTSQCVCPIFCPEES
jgi:hypothetical protein